MSLEKINTSVESGQEEQARVSLVENSVQIGSDVKQSGVPTGVQFGADYTEG